MAICARSPEWVYSLSDMARVIPALFDVLADQRRSAGVSETDVASAFGSRERTVLRWEAHENYPWGAKGRDLERAVAAYAVTAGLDPLDLWRDAIHRAEGAEGELRAMGPDAGGAGRENAAEEAADAREDQESPPGESTPGAPGL